jgi:hypothetical protein
MSNQIAKIENATFDAIRSPEVFTAIASQVQTHVKQNGLISNIKGKMYPQVEAWQFAGGLLNLFPRVTAVVDVSNGQKGVYKYRAEVEIYDYTGEEPKFVTAAVAICSNEEPTKKHFAEYAIASMAQTRAIGKGFRVLLGWLMKASGYEPTPAEDMDQASDDSNKPNLIAIKQEYRKFAERAIDACATAADVVDLGRIATAFNDDESWLGNCRDQYTSLKNAGKF